MTDEYQEGKNAFFSGLSNESNPFNYGTPEYTYWFDGWWDAKSNNSNN